MNQYEDYIQWQELEALLGCSSAVDAASIGVVLLVEELRQRAGDPWSVRRLEVVAERAATLFGTDATRAAREAVAAGELLPGTSDDEILFVACIRCHELLFRAMAERIARFCGGAWTETPLPYVAGSFSVCRSLMSLLGSIGPTRFAELRAASGRASAVDSPGYARLLAACALVARVPRSVYEAESLGGRVAAANRAHSAWARLHYALAEAYLGSQPGTGGSSGADYLAARLVIPLIGAPIAVDVTPRGG